MFSVYRQAAASFIRFYFRLRRRLRLFARAGQTLANVPFETFQRSEPPVPDLAFSLGNIALVTPKPPLLAVHFATCWPDRRGS